MVKEQIIREYLGKRDMQKSTKSIGCIKECGGRWLMWFNS